MSQSSPFHTGEQAVQERLGVRRVEQWARHGIRSSLPDQHREFYAGLPWVVAAARDEHGQAWASVLVGHPGFISSPDSQTLQIKARLLPGDPLAQALSQGSDVGLLGIELATRRRNRANGRVRSGGFGDADGKQPNADGAALAVQISQCFGNCPRFIHPREWHWVETPNAVQALQSRALSAAQQATFAQTDTLFIASGYGTANDDPTLGMDVSHRGGDPGFIRIADERTVLIPDYAGNNFFNTLGNLSRDPRAGLLLVDFEHGSLLQLTGLATVDFESRAVDALPGALRRIVFEVEQVVERVGVLPLRWVASGASSD